ncbi:MAG TPA: DUF305 domain-containing protein [Terriglobia bacterium]|nr:DUF305 domain-containing protein [Terriglobia bacterium]
MKRPTILMTTGFALALAGGVVVAQEHEHDHGAAAHDARAGESTTTLLYNQADLMFLYNMSVHHQQAVVMARLVPERSNREVFIQYAGYVGRAQAAEIDLMQSLLKLAADRGLQLPEGYKLDGDPPMKGMLSKAQMAALEASKGAEFERLWLEGMIYHHQGAVDMAFAQQDQQLANGRRPYALNVLVEDILEEQRGEITKMNNWLEEWGLSRR